MEMVCASKTLVSTYKAVWCYNPVHNLNRQYCGNLNTSVTKIIIV